MTRQTWTAVVSAVLFVALAAVMALLPVPYVSWSAGATFDVLGEAGGAPVLKITGAPTYPTTGELRATTVAVTRVDSHLTLSEAFFSYWAPDREVIPREAVYAPGQDAGSVQANETQEMDISQLTAAAAALRAAGGKVTELPMVTSVSPGGPADGILRPGDLIEAIDGTSVATLSALTEAVRAHKVGDTVTLHLRRGAEKPQVQVKTTESNGSPPVPVLGITLQTGYAFGGTTITFATDPTIGGPSAGLIFALAAYEVLTPGDLVAGRHIAGTGTITGSGEVGPIGGVEEKLVAARGAGATLFLVPWQNCPDVSRIPDGIRLVKVASLSESVSALEALKDPAKESAVAGCS